MAMLTVNDEILDTSLQPDPNPRYTIRDNKGNIIHENIQIEMKTPVVQNGTPVNRELFLDIGFHAGMILMWSGSIATIPTGWALCDGSNGTPDLRNRFIVGAGSTYSVGNTGGSNSVTLTEGQIPSHAHSGTTDGTETYMSHRTGTTKSGDSSTNSFVSSISAEAHTHTFTTSSVGSGQSHENRPPYYALAYIMKI